MSVENSPESIENYNRVLFNVNNFMVEQTETADYNQLINTVVDQLDKLLRPIATTYNEYDEQSRVLRIKVVKANQGILDLFLKISGKKLSSFATPVDAQLYEEIKAERVKLFSTLHEATGRAIPKTVSSAVSKAIGINCYLDLSYVVEDQVFGTSVIALSEEPDQSIMELLKAYAYFTSLSLKRVITDQALNQSKQELKTISDNIVDLVSLTDGEGKFTFLSGNHLGLLGYEKEELLGKSVLEIVYAEDLEKIAELFSKHISAGEDGRAEYRAVRKDGNLIWVETVGRIIFDNAQVNGALFVTRDITDRKQAEEALKNSEQELRTIADNMTDVVAMADVEGRFTYLSESNYHLSGYKPSELLGKSIFELIHEEDLSALGVIFQEGDVEGRKDARVEYRVRHKKGGYVWVETIGSLMLDDNGQPSGALFVSRDISDRKHAQEQIERLAQIADNAPSSILVHDYEGNLFYANEHTFHLYGYIKEEFMKLNLRDFSAPESAELIPARMKDIKEKGKAEFEVRHVRKDGSTVPMQVYVKQTEWFGKPALLSVSTDITERKKTETIIIESEQRLVQAQHIAKLGDFTWDVNSGEVNWSDGLFKLLGYDKSETINYAKVNAEIHHPDDLERVTKWLNECIESGSGILTPYEYRLIRKDKIEIYVQTIGVIERDKDNQIKVFATLQDITEHKRIERKLSFIKDVITSSSSAIATSDLEGYITYGNPFFQKLWGFIDQEEFLGKPIRNYWMLGDHEENIVRIIQSEGTWEGELKGIKKDGSLFDVQVTAATVFDNIGNPIAMTSTSIDITDRKKAEEEIRYMSFHDQLTDLHNRYYFEACEEELKDIPVLSVIMTDVNGLKLINDTYGHQVGDEMLKKYAVLLRESFKQSDLIFRWGGDEFIVILKNTEEAKSWELCNRLIKHCGETFFKDIPLSISVGISSKSQGGDIDEAIKEAEDIMYKNKLTESKSCKNLIMKTLQQALSEKSFETKEHIDRITLVGRQFGERLGLSASELSRLETLIMLHDIGKINIDSHILLKETALTDEEWVEIKKHPEVGYRITRTAEEFAYVAEDILAHHERWDGKGYPQGLQGENTPYLARLLNIIDNYVVMSNGRPYKKKMLTEEIIEEIERCSGKQFDPDLAKEFVAFLKEGTSSGLL